MPSLALRVGMLGVFPFRLLSLPEPVEILFEVLTEFSRYRLVGEWVGLAVPGGFELTADGLLDLFWTVGTLRVSGNGHGALGHLLRNP